MNRPGWHCLGILWLVLGTAPSAEAGSRILRAGENLAIGEEYVLTGEDVLEIHGTPDKRCRIDANAQAIRTTGKWTGRIKLTHCDIRGLGSAGKPAFDVTAGGDGAQIVIEHCDFHACGAIHLTNSGQSATLFRHNRILPTSLVPVSNLPSESPPVFRAAGDSPAPKRFQGNYVSRSVVQFENARNWLIGGEQDADSNLFIGMRASLSIHRCGDCTVRGNYLHTEIPSYRWSQVHTISVLAPCANLVIEHNVIRHGQWVVRGLQGQFRYNLVLDADGHNFIIGPQAHTHIHHNIFARYCTIDPNLNATIAVIYPGDDIQIYNNTFDGGGKDLARPWHVPAIEVSGSAFLQSLRSNAFVHHPTRFASGTAIVRPGFSEKKTLPGPARLGYADYNLFFNPDAASPDRYAVSVADKTAGVDAGFGKHDLPAQGTSASQGEPKFEGPIPKQFPFTDDVILTRQVTVSQILRFYRDAYTPADGSPLLRAGDPADGAGNFIGAVGAGKEPPNDRFGRWGQATRQSKPAQGRAPQR